jgi:hypothetical protein
MEKGSYLLLSPPPKVRSSWVMGRRWVGMICCKKCLMKTDETKHASILVHVLCTHPPRRASVPGCFCIVVSSSTTIHHWATSERAASYIVVLLRHRTTILTVPSWYRSKESKCVSRVSTETTGTRTLDSNYDRTLPAGTEKRRQAFELFKLKWCHHWVFSRRIDRLLRSRELAVTELETSRIILT